MSGQKPTPPIVIDTDVPRRKTVVKATPKTQPTTVAMLLSRIFWALILIATLLTIQIANTYYSWLAQSLKERSREERQEEETQHWREYNQDLQHQLFGRPSR